MEFKNYCANVLKGVLGAVSITVLLTAIISLVMTFVDIKPSVFSCIYVIITSIGLILGSIIAAKIHGHKGWLVGLAVGVLFYISLYGIGVLFGAYATLEIYDLFKFLLCIVLGVLSGILGINFSK